MNETKELIFLQDSKNGNEPVIDICFKNGIWIPNAYSSDKEYLDISYDDNIIFEAQAISDLILFFIDNLNTYLNQKRKYLVKNRFAIYSQAKDVVSGSLLALFALVISGTFSRREQIPFQNREIGVSYILSPLENISKGLPVSANALLEYEELVQLSKDESFQLVLSLKGGGGPFLADPNPTYMASSSKLNSISTRETRKALPKAFQKMLDYENRAKVSALTPLPLHSRSSLSKNRIDNRSTFSGALDLYDVRNIKVEALDASDDERNYLDYNLKHLKGIQDVKGESILINNQDKAKCERAMADVLTREYNNLKKVKENLNISWREKERQIKRIEETIRLEKEHQKYHLDNTLSRNRTTMAIPRNPTNWRYDGNIAITYQTYDDKDLLEEKKKLLYNKYADLTSFICHHIAGEKSNKNTPSQKEQFSEIAGKCLQSACDINIARTKFIEIYYRGSEKQIAWAERKAECGNPKHKGDMVKSKFTRVDSCLLDMVDSKWIRPRMRGPR